MPRAIPPLALALALALAAPAAAQADVLGEAFRALPERQRIAVQRELARADLFLARTDGHWNAATERALLRGVETVALKSHGDVQPRIGSPEEARLYMQAITDGSFSELLYGGSLWHWIFTLGGNTSS